MNFIGKYLWCVWTPIGLCYLFDSTIDELEWWVFLVPLFILVELSFSRRTR